jgi:16S rRNA (cytosine1402-N4)-methyltransferase
MSTANVHPTAETAPGHVTVLLEEAVSALSPVADGTYVDGTFGGGGHTGRLLSWEPPVGRVIAVDADRDAEARAASLAASMKDRERFTFARGNFRDLSAILDGLGIPAINGALFDLGVSSYQFDEGDRGFSFRSDAPLDMRFDQSGGVSAATLVNTLADRELADIIWRYGDERQSRQIAAAIVRVRDVAPIQTTFQLAHVVEAATGGRKGKPIHPATRTFQALRIAVNDELGALEHVLATSVDRLAPGGRLVVISFHSLEDRIVKRFIEKESRTCVCPPAQPVCTCDTVPRMKRIGRTVRPDSAEQRRNPRSRSAIMRIAERLGPDGEPDRRGIKA